MCIVRDRSHSPVGRSRSRCCRRRWWHEIPGLSTGFAGRLPWQPTFTTPTSRKCTDPAPKKTSFILPCASWRGRTLHDVQSALALQRRLGDTRHLRPPHVRRVARVARDIASALAAIHARGLVHRDVKPANIILEHAGDDDHEALAGRPVLVDFGLIRPVGQSDLTGTKTLLGTPAYASPETQVGREVDARADVFSLGAILHDLLTLDSARGTQPGIRWTLRGSCVESSR